MMGISGPCGVGSRVLNGGVGTERAHNVSIGKQTFNPFLTLIDVT